MRKSKVTERQFDDWAKQLQDWVSEAVSPFNGDTSAKQDARKKLAKKDILYFFRTYLPHYFIVDFAPFHSGWARRAVLKNHVYIAAVPREHAKSTFWSFGVPLYNIVYQFRRFHILCSDTNDLASDFVLAIKVELEQNKRIRHDFGDLRGFPWTTSNFVTSNDVRVWARGYGEPIRGRKFKNWRADYICSDDLENERSVRSPRQTAGRVEWIKTALLGSMDADGLLVYAQNMFSPRSAIAQMVADTKDDGSPRYDSTVLAAIIDEGTPAERPLWPALWPMDRIRAKIEQVGLRAFRKEFMNQVESDDAEFKSSLVQYYTPDILFDRDSCRIATFCDPSAKSGKKNDYKAVITVARDAKRFYVLHAWIRHAGVTEMLNACLKAVQEYHRPGDMIGIEDNMFGDFLHQAIEEHAKDTGVHLPWRPVNHSANKEARIVGTLSYLYQQGNIQFVKNQSDQNRLLEQLWYLEDPNINDDGPDALEGAVSMLQGGCTGKIDYQSGGQRRFGAKKGAW